MKNSKTSPQNSDHSKRDWVKINKEINLRIQKFNTTKK